jgi:hypothetical protein
MTAFARKSRRSNAIQVIFLAGIIAGTLDITAAGIQYYINSGKGPGNVFRFIASGYFGDAAFNGGMAMAAWGLFFHYLIALLFAAFFFMLYPTVKFLSRNKIITGLLYGIFVWLVMNLIVVPMSNAPSGPIDLVKAVIPILILMFCIGLPIVLIIGKYYDSLVKDR